MTPLHLGWDNSFAYYPRPTMAGSLTPWPGRGVQVASGRAPGGGPRITGEAPWG